MATSGIGSRYVHRASCYFLAVAMGCIGLVAQVAWARLFVQMFGATAQPTAVVLALFLAGLALGALRLGRYADRTNDPLQLSGCLVALSGVAIAIGTVIRTPATSLLDDLFGQVQYYSILRTSFHVVLAGLLVLPPSILWGGVAPALIRAAGSSRQAVRPQFSALFGFETLGGAIGALAAGFYLIAAYGIYGTLWLAAGVGMSAGTLGVLIARNASSSLQNDERSESFSVPFPSKSPHDFWVLVAIGFAGFASMGMEVAWTRLILLIVGGDTYSFTVVVTSFLLGHVLGALIANRISRRLIHPLSMYGWLQLATAGSALILLTVFYWLAGGVGQTQLASFEGHWATVLTGRFVLSGCLLLIPATLVGLGFPVVASHILCTNSQLGTRVGRLYAASAFGNVVGSLAVGFLLIPAIGLQLSIVALAASNLAAAACVVFPVLHFCYPGKPQFVLSQWSPLLQMALILAGLSVCSGWQLLRPIKPLGLDAMRRDEMVSYYREGLAGTVAVLQSRDDWDRRKMVIDGIIIGESRGGVDEKQRMLAHLPRLLRPGDPNRHILTIGLGTGILAGELVQQPGSRVVCVELSQAVVEGARHFADLNGNVHDHPRTTIVVGDGIHYLRQSKQKFSSIVSDAKSRPGHSNNAHFYSVDYYALCHLRLAPDGLMFQWVSLDTPLPELRVILRTFVRVFPHSYIAVAPPDSLYLIGASEQLNLDIDEIQRHLDSHTALHLRDYGWRHACDVLAMFLADGDSVERWLMPDTPINTLERPVIEFQALEALALPRETRTQENLTALLGLTEHSLETMQTRGADQQMLRNCQESARLSLEAAALALSQDIADWKLAEDKFDEGRRLGAAA